MQASNSKLIIKEQHNCKATGYWKTNSVKYNFLLIAHEYLFVFKNDVRYCNKQVKCITSPYCLGYTKALDGTI